MSAARIEEEIIVTPSGAKIMYASIWARVARPTLKVR
jgi:hypothetical protein